MSDNDVEKQSELKQPSIDTTAVSDGGDSSPILLQGRLARWNAKVEGLAGLEARGITRVLPEEKHGGGRKAYLQMFALWFSINVCANNIIVGLLGPLVFSLGWVDCVCIVIFANALSSCAPSYTATFGPTSGNRTMVYAPLLDDDENLGGALTRWLDTWSLLHGILAIQDNLSS